MTKRILAPLLATLGIAASLAFAQSAVIIVDTAPPAAAVEVAPAPREG